MERAHSGSGTRKGTVGDVLAVAPTGGITIDSSRGAASRWVPLAGMITPHGEGRATRRAMSVASTANTTPNTEAWASSSAAAGNATAKTTSRHASATSIHGRLIAGT